MFAASPPPITDARTTGGEKARQNGDGREETIHMVGPGDRALHPAHHRHGHDEHVGQQKVILKSPSTAEKRAILYYYNNYYM